MELMTPIATPPECSGAAPARRGRDEAAQPFGTVLAEVIEREAAPAAAPGAEPEPEDGAAEAAVPEAGTPDPEAEPEAEGEPDLEAALPIETGGLLAPAPSLSAAEPEPTLIAVDPQPADDADATKPALDAETVKPDMQALSAGPVEAGAGDPPDGRPLPAHAASTTRPGEPATESAASVQPEQAPRTAPTPPAESAESAPADDARTEPTARAEARPVVEPSGNPAPRVVQAEPVAGLAADQRPPREGAIADAEEEKPRDAQTPRPAAGARTAAQRSEAGPPRPTSAPGGPSTAQEPLPAPEPGAQPAFQPAPRQDEAPPAQGDAARQTPATTHAQTPLAAPLAGPVDGEDSARPAEAARLAASHRPAEPAELPDRMLRIVEQLRAGGESLHRAEIRLDPPELGRIRIELNVEGERAWARLVVENHAARDQVQAELPRIRQLLESQGLEGARVEVQLRQGGAERHGRGGEGSFDGGTEEFATGDEENGVSVIRATAHDGLIDLRA